MNLFSFAGFIIVFALIFEFVNGFHDTANAVATSIATNSLEPFQAISISALFNLLGALSGTAVAVTIAKGFFDPSYANNIVILASLIAAIFWNLTTWMIGFPSSSSHALIGSLLGAVIVNSHYTVIKFHTVLDKLILPMVLSPCIGFILALIIVVLLHKLFIAYKNPRKANNYIRELQVLSTAFLSFSHGTNDAQKTMGIITITLFNSGVLRALEVPTWVIFVCALCMAMGTLSGGVKIIKTLSTRVAKLRPVSGFSAEISSSLLIFIGSRFGMPLSTTHAVSGSIMGAGNFGGVGVNWGVVKSIVIAWMLTIPCCAIFAGILVYIIKLMPFI